VGNRKPCIFFSSGYDRSAVVERVRCSALCRVSKRPDAVVQTERDYRRGREGDARRRVSRGREVDKRREARQTQPLPGCHVHVGIELFARSEGGRRRGEGATRACTFRWPA
jgi:hypothetical protein